MHKTVVQPHKSSLGMDANLAVLIVYIATAIISWIPFVGWIAWAVPLVFFFMEKNSGFVKFHAMQALGIGVLRAALTIVFTVIFWATVPRGLYGLYAPLGIWVVISLVATIIYIAISLVILYVLIMAWKWKQVELPVIGPIARRAGAKLDSVDVSQFSNFSAAKGEQPDAAANAAICPGCGYANPGGTAFCGNCGQKLN